MSDLTPLPQLAAQINEEHALAEQAAKTAVEHAMKAGELLLQAKDQVKHGEWLGWLKGNCRVGARQAQKWMRIAKHPELANANSKSYLGIDGSLGKIADHGDQSDYSRARKAALDALQACLDDVPNMTLEQCQYVVEHAEEDLIKPAQKIRKDAAKKAEETIQIEFPEEGNLDEYLIKSRFMEYVEAYSWEKVNELLTTLEDIVNYPDVFGVTPAEEIF